MRNLVSFWKDALPKSLFKRFLTRKLLNCENQPAYGLILPPLELYALTDMRKRMVTGSLTAEISVDCGNFQLAAVNMFLKVGSIGKFESFSSNSSFKSTLELFKPHL